MGNTPNQRRTSDGMRLTPVSYPDVVALLTSDALSAIEEPIATKCQFRILDDGGAAATSDTQAEISVSGLSVEQLQGYLTANRDAIVDFGIRFLSDALAADDEQEYAPGESQDPDEDVETLGYGNGFGIKLAIYHNFLANRPPAELRAFLKNRRIPKHTRFARQLAVIFSSCKQP